MKAVDALGLFRYDSLLSGECFWFALLHIGFRGVGCPRPKMFLVITLATWFAKNV